LLHEVDLLLWCLEIQRLIVLLFKSNRADITARRMESDPVIEEDSMGTSPRIHAFYRENTIEKEKYEQF